MPLPRGAPRRRFPTTRWTQVVAARSTASTTARAAMAALCETYWAPVHEFIRHTTRSSDAAPDLTQAFFAHVLEHGDLGSATPERGRFRSFLLTAVRHFLANQHRHDRAAKRGGGLVHVPLDAGGDASRALDSTVSSAVTPETLFERQWAATALNAALVRLARQYDQSGRRELFDRLRPFLTGDDSGSCADCARALAMSEGAVRVAVHRLRQQYGRALRDTLADTVNDPADIDSEVQYLLKVVSGGPPALPV